MIVEELIASASCFGEVVSGIVEYYYEGEMVFAIDFGNGECDGVVTVTWLEEDGTLESEVVEFWELFVDDEEYEEECFDFVLPVSITMPDGTAITITNDDDWDIVENWYDENPNSEEEPEFNYPIQIEYEDGDIITINNDEELWEAEEDCYGEY